MKQLRIKKHSCNQYHSCWNKYSIGFTLIELLVVISVIAILSSLAYVNYSHVQAKNRDYKRIQDLKSIANALELYYNEHGEYPFTNSPVGAEDSAVEGQTHFLTELQPYFPDGKVPIDPINKLCYFWAGPGVCDTSPYNWWYTATYRYDKTWYNTTPEVPGSGAGTCGGTDFYALSSVMETIKKGDPLYSECTCPYDLVCGLRVDTRDYNNDGVWDPNTERVPCNDPVYISEYGPTGVCSIACPAQIPDNANDYCSSDGTWAYFVECNAEHPTASSGGAYSICGFGPNRCTGGECTY